jgi:hypothetical protein
VNSQAGPTTNCATHLIGNPDGSKDFKGNCTVTYNGVNYSFPDLGAVTEASIGNLETNNDFLDYAALGVVAQSGYQKAYFQAAQSNLQPFSATIAAMLGCLNELTSIADVHFGLTMFNDIAGTTPTQTYSASNISPLFPPGGTGNFPLPGVPLDPNSNNYNSGTAIPGLLTSFTSFPVSGGRNTAAAIQAAITQIQNGARANSGGGANANPAILLVTDGVPTTPLNGPAGITNTTQAATDARSAAVQAHALGIPIFCIVISQASDGSDQDPENDMYNDTNSNPTSGGIAAISGYGAKYYQVNFTDAPTTQAALLKAFGNVGRQLVSVIK